MVALMAGVAVVCAAAIEVDAQMSIHAVTAGTAAAVRHTIDRRGKRPVAYVNQDWAGVPAPSFAICTEYSGRVLRGDWPYISMTAV